MAGYLGSTPVPQATQHRESFTATEGQTSFATAGYTPQFLDVFLNGSHLSPADFVATNSSDVVLVVAASADDICDIVSYTPFEVADATFTGTTTTATASLDGAVTINDSSADVDFRVESNLDSHGLFLQGSSGNLRYGGDVEPRAWNSTFRAMDIGGGGSLWSTKAAGAMVQLSSNTHWNGSNYVATATGSGGRYYQDSGDHAFLGAPSVSAGVNQAFVITTLITEEGIVTQPLQPAFNAFLNASTGATALSANGTHKVAFAHEFFDQASNFNPGSGNHNFTCPAGGAGVYHFSTGVLLLGIGTGTSNCEISIKHESHHAYYGSRVDGSTGWGDSYVSLAADTHLYLDVGDVVAVYVYATEAFGIYGHSSGSSTYFTGVKVA